MIISGLVAVLCGVAPAAPRATANAPKVVAVEPPSWWAGHSINPVRLLIRGSNLEGASLGGAPGVTTGNVRVSGKGTYAFVDVTLASSAKPGLVALRLTTPRGAATARFEVLPPISRIGGFAGFSEDDFIYLAMPDRFANGDTANDEPKRSPGLTDRTKPRRYHGGDLRGTIKRLPYLKDLGVTALWLNPWYDNTDKPNQTQAVNGEPIADYHGYGATDFYGVEEHFGDLPTLKELVEKAHSLGIKVIQDQVANHTGPAHPWAADSPTPTWLSGTLAQHLNETWQTWTLADPYAGPGLRRETVDGWFVDVLPDINQNDPEAARYVIQNTLWWVGITGLDGIRQDTWPYVPRAFWREWMAAIKTEFPRLRVVGEMWDGNAALVSFFQGGAARFDGIDSGVDSLFDFPLYYAVRGVFVEGKPLKDLAAMLAQDRLYVDPRRLVTFLGNHDVLRFMGEKNATIAGLKRAFTFLLTTRGIPMVYYGDEIGLPGGEDPDNRRDFPGGFPGDTRDAFTAEGRTADENGVFDHVRFLASVRAENEALRRGRLVNLYATDDAYVYARAGSSGFAVVALNNGKQARRLSVEVASVLPDGTALEDRLGCGGPAEVEGGRLSLALPASCDALYVSSGR